MSTISEVVRKAQGKGIKFNVVDGFIDLDYPPSTTPRVLDWIRDNKEEILLYLEDPYRDGLGAKWHIVNSKVLGEEVVWAQDDAVVPPEATQGRVVYREAELRDFMASKPTQEHIRLVHETKKVFGGTIEQEEEWE